MKVPPRAIDLGLVGCHICGMVCRHEGRDHGLACPRCGTALYQRKHHAYAVTWALLIAAAILFIPANVVPIMNTASLYGSYDSTIIGGVVEFWQNKEYDIAIVIFVASIVVPTLKFIALGLLLITSRRGVTRGRRQRAKLYRGVELIGYWSMLDVFVVALMSALVHFGFLGSAAPRPGVIYFGLVVVLTMFAAMSFDPRLIWDGESDDD